MQVYFFLFLLSYFLIHCLWYFFGNKSRTAGYRQKYHFFVFRYLYSPDMFNETKENFKTFEADCYPSEIKYNGAVSYSSNILMELICVSWTMVMNICIALARKISLNISIIWEYFDGTNNLTDFLLFFHCFSTFVLVFHMLFLFHFFISWSKNCLLSISTLQF